MENTDLVQARLYSVLGLCTLIDAIRNNGEMLPFASWDSDLGNARGCLEEAAVKLSALCGSPAVLGDTSLVDESEGSIAVAFNNRAGRAAEGAAAVLDGSPTTFSKLPQGSVDSALTQMVGLRNYTGLKTEWATVEGLRDAIAGGYDPGNNFTVRVFPSGDVVVGVR